ncbi:ISAs1 family transposase [Shigella boydii]|uniref:Receptor n=2 Tax=Shigella TaxID=620 RepID=A0A2X2IVB2_SHIBO|nr:receptor [Shigella boydii]VDG95471.1 receptor [Shigella dysenteriae]
MTIFAVISGAESWEDIEDFGETHLDFLKQYGDFENGIPVHDTIARVVSCISPAKFHECFINWMRDCHSSDDKDVIAIDGKTGNDSNLLIVFYVQIMPDDLVMQLHRF